MVLLLETVETKPELPELMTAKEVCELLRIPYGTVYYLLQQGKLPAIRIGGRWRIKRELLNQNVLKEKPEMEIPRIALHLEDMLLKELVEKQLQQPGMAVFMDTIEPNTIITDDINSIPNFGGRVISIIADNDPLLTAAQTRSNLPVTLTTSLQIADPKTLRNLLGIAA